MVGHKTESIYRRYAIADESMLQEAGEKMEIAEPRREAPSAPSLWLGASLDEFVS
jgi:hypothetical protein